MPAIIFGLLVLVLALWVLGVISRVDPKIAARVLKASGGILAIGFAVFLGLRGEVGVIFFAGETFLLRGGNDFSITHQRSGGVVIIRRDAKDIARRGHGSKKRVKRPGDAGTGRENQNGSQQQQHYDQRNEPPFFFLFGKF